jgi:hypothetical protein
MSRIEYRDVSPGLAADAAESQPHSLFRAGQQVGRLDYPRDPEAGTHIAVIVRGPRIWVIDRERKTVEETRDPGPSYAFRVPVLDPKQHPDLRSLEFGQEFAFLEAHGAAPVRIQTAAGAPADRYEVAIDDVAVVLIASPGSRVARELRIFEGGELTRAFQYDAYELDLELDSRLFLPPQNLQPAEQPR